MRFLSPLTIVTFATIIALESVSAASYRTIYRGTHDGAEIIAISVGKKYSEKRIGRIVSPLLGPNVTILVYYDYKTLASATPIAIYVADETTLYDSDPARSSAPPTIGDRIASAYTSGGRVGAICRDGSRSSARGRGACSHHGGVARWLYAQVKNRRAVIALIYEDFLLVSAGRKQRTDSDAIVLVRVLNKDY